MSNISKKQQPIIESQSQPISFSSVFSRSSLIKLLKFSLWFIGLYLSCWISFQKLYFILSIFYLIFNNLGHRKNGQMSAYSVFNKGFKRIPGTFSPEDMIMRRTGNKSFQNNCQDGQNDKIMDKNQQRKAKQIDQYFSNVSKYGNKMCYCGSDVKFKKCCLIKKKSNNKNSNKEENNRDQKLKIIDGEKQIIKLDQIKRYTYIVQTLVLYGFFR